MSNFDLLNSIIKDYFDGYDLEVERQVSTLHDTSENNSDIHHVTYLYNGENLPAINMDLVAKSGYKRTKHAEGKDNIVNTADAFLVDQANEWTFVEFKDSPIKADHSNLKNNILKKAYSNWYMLLDILYEMYGKGKVYPDFTYDQPTEFARRHIKYILVCSASKNPRIYDKMKACRLAKTKYTPPFMQRLKDYLFLEACVYTEDEFEREFVRSFQV